MPTWHFSCSIVGVDGLWCRRPRDDLARHLEGVGANEPSLKGEKKKKETNEEKKKLLLIPRRHWPWGSFRLSTWRGLPPFFFFPPSALAFLVKDRHAKRGWTRVELYRPGRGSTHFTLAALKTFSGGGLLFCVLHNPGINNWRASLLWEIYGGGRVGRRRWGEGGGGDGTEREKERKKVHWRGGARACVIHLELHFITI